MYLDPGSGSVILQTVLASLLGAGVIIRVFWKKIKSLGGKKNLENVEIEEENNSDEFDS
ncbi:MAG: hypothetical protein JW908_12560 [Anaerolineales bacterium]|nr:hypothetical protein [Anaerolineales bacterium]